MKNEASGSQYPVIEFKRAELGRQSDHLRLPHPVRERQQFGVAARFPVMKDALREIDRSIQYRFMERRCSRGVSEKTPQFFERNHLLLWKQHFNLHQPTLAAMTSLQPRSSALGIRPRTEKALPNRPQEEESTACTTPRSSVKRQCPG